MAPCQTLPRSRNAEAALVRLAMCAAFANCAHAAPALRHPSASRRLDAAEASLVTFRGRHRVHAAPLPRSSAFNAGHVKRHTRPEEA
jgi:hypothetical protein